MLQELEPDPTEGAPKGTIQASWPWVTCLAVSIGQAVLRNVCRPPPHPPGLDLCRLQLTAAVCISYPWGDDSNKAHLDLGSSQRPAVPKFGTKRSRGGIKGAFEGNIKNNTTNTMHVFNQKR